MATPAGAEVIDLDDDEYTDPLPQPPAGKRVARAIASGSADAPFEIDDDDDEEEDGRDGGGSGVQSAAQSRGVARRADLAALQALARDWRGECTQKRDGTLEWKCSRGHTWEAEAEDVLLHHSWCPHWKCLRGVHPLRRGLAGGRGPAGDSGGSNNTGGGDAGGGGGGSAAAAADGGDGARDTAAAAAAAGGAHEPNPPKRADASQQQQQQQKPQPQPQQQPLADESPTGPSDCVPGRASQPASAPSAAPARPAAPQPGSGDGGLPLPPADALLEMATASNCTLVHDSRPHAAAGGAFADRQTPLLWKCAAGCEFRQSLAEGFRVPGWCPECMRHAEATLRQLSSIAIQHNGQCCKLINNQHRPPLPMLRWHRNEASLMEMRCQRQHAFGATIGVLRVGGWCPTCELEDKERGRAAAAHQARETQRRQQWEQQQQQQQQQQREQQREQEQRQQQQQQWQQQ